MTMRQKEFRQRGIFSAGTRALHDAYANLAEAGKCIEDQREEIALLRAALDGVKREAMTQQACVQRRIRDNALQAQNHLYYRLGHVIAVCWESFLHGIWKMPFLLLREYFSYQRNESGKRQEAIKKIFLRLRGGYTNDAVCDLQKFINSKHANMADKEFASFCLASGLYEKGRYEEAYTYTKMANNCLPVRMQKWFALKVLCLLRCCRYEEAARLLREEMERNGKPEDLLVLYATVERRRLLASGASRKQAEHAQLCLLNEAFAMSGLAPLALRDPAQPLTIANIHTPLAEPCKKSGLKVSVIMPAYNAEQTIEFALRSLLEQTWKNIEILVVDDASTDATVNIVTQLRAEDMRIQLIRKEKNSGPYAAANAAFPYATGDLITTHGSDDWSHGQKIALQAQRFITGGEIANISHMTRLSSDLEYDGLPDRIISRNLSSLMFKRTITSLIGTWQEVRVSGDAEYRKRIELVFGAGSVVSPDAAPLSIALARPDSLTRKTGMAFATLHAFSGIRRLYAASYTSWHEAVSQSRVLSSIRDEHWIFPTSNDAAASSDRRYDLIIVSDFTLPGGSMRSSLNYAMAARRMGKRVALAHWKKYAFDPGRRIDPLVFIVCRTHKIDMLCSADEAEADYVLVGLASILSHIPDILPQICANRVLVLVNQFASTFATGKAVQYDPTIARRNAQAVFGQEGLWIPISGWVQELMRKDRRYPQPWHASWHPLLDSMEWTGKPVLWQGGKRNIPVIGRHGRDAYAKWPASKAAMCAAYGVNAPVRVRLMGGADIAIRLLGYTPPNWEVLDFGALPVQTFIQSLDFFVHFPHDQYIEEFGRVVMEAMVAGKPAILPERFRATFGDAAFYCAPKEVIPLVMRCWRDEKLYRRQAERGREFVVKTCDWSCLKERLEIVASYEMENRQ
jgi:glycosyltransferase involved in cell wall biosynthesis